jgi:hypothetical protein
MNKSQRKVYQIIASSLQAYNNCIENKNTEWLDRHRETIKRIVENYLPSGSGFDSGTRFDIDESEPNKLIFYTSYHHMNSSGCYDGWSDHTITVTPSLSNGFDLHITPDKDYFDLKEIEYQVAMYDACTCGAFKNASAFYSAEHDHTCAVETCEAYPPDLGSTLDYFHDTFNYALNIDLVWDKYKQRYVEVK